MSPQRALMIAGLSICIGAIGQPAHASPILFGPTAYTSSTNIPAGFFSGGFSLEDFEDGSLDLGITGTGSGTFILGPSSVTDSVDADDGLIDGNGNGGHTFVGNANTGVTFTFSGTLPTAAGLVWTDGVSPVDLLYPNGPYLTGPYPDNVLFEAFGPGMTLLGSWTFQLGTGLQSYYGDTAEDRFLGVQDAGGILALRITESHGGQIELDHVMFGTAGGSDAAPVPEPATLTLLGLGGLLALARQRFRRS